MLGGVTSLSYLLAPAAVIGLVLNVADDVPGGFVERIGEAAADRVPTDVLGLTLIGLAVVAVVIAAAAAGSLLVDWAFTLRDEGERFAASRGLLTSRSRKRWPSRRWPVSTTKTSKNDSGSSAAA